MKRKFAFINLLLLMYGSFTFAQNEKQFTHQIDSIQNLINSNPKENIETVRLLNELARLHFYNGQAKEGFVTTRQALSLAEEIGFEGGKVMYYLTLSVYHDNNEDLRIYYQKKAEWLSNSFANQSRNYFVIPEIPEFNEGSDFESLKEKYLTVHAYFQGEADKEIMANILFNLGYIAYRLQNLEESIDYLDRIIAIYKELDQVYPVFLCLTYKMGNLKALGRFEDAKNIELDLVNLFLSSKDENAIGLIASNMASAYTNDGRYLLSIEYYLKSIEEFERVNDKEMLYRLYYDLGVAYENLSISSKAVESYEKSIDALKILGYETYLSNVYGTIIFPLIDMGEYEKANKYLKLAEQDTMAANSFHQQGRLYDARGQMLMSQQQYDLAIPYFKKALNAFLNISEFHWAVPFIYVNIADCNLQIGNTAEALSNALLSIDKTPDDDVRLARRVNLLLSNIYEKIGNEKAALTYLKAYQEIVEKSDKNDELSRIADAEIKSILDKSQKEIFVLEREQELANQENQIQRLWLFSAAGALISALMVLYILFRNNRNKQKTNTALKQQKEKVEQTLEKLKSTQSQLVQAEKMASLGELTAGIAHEIQNPLNFVNNFSEVNAELIDELSDEMDNENFDEVKAIAKDLKENELKINHHGKRADAIVKGMLQHSRAGSGNKIPTDLNALADEYLRLSYHGLRAKDKSFNADFKTDFDAELPKIEVIPQDIGRVLLNLINNAFYACAERSRSAVNDKTLTGFNPTRAGLSELNTGSYKPTVAVSTINHGDQIEIRVKDNGNGIPEEIKDKIFQPFFTTKPTGQGTGLGLSMSYDIITKGHGGELRAETKNGEGSVFKILLPI